MNINLYMFPIIFLSSAGSFRTKMTLRLLRSFQMIKYCCLKTQVALLAHISIRLARSYNPSSNAKRLFLVLRLQMCFDSSVFRFFLEGAERVSVGFYTVPQNLKRARRRFPWSFPLQVSPGKLHFCANTFLQADTQLISVVTRT